MSSPDSLVSFFFFFNDTATTEIYTLSLHDALPISRDVELTSRRAQAADRAQHCGLNGPVAATVGERSEEHTSELQSRVDLVCRLLLEKKKKKKEGIHREKKQRKIQD